MKKTMIPLLSASALLLFACGGSSEQVIPSGKEVAKADTVATFNQAQTNLVECDAFGVSISGNYSMKSKGAFSMDGQSQNVSYSMEGKDLSLGLAVKKDRNKLQSIKASASASGSFAYSISGSGVSQSHTFSPVLNAYMADETLYVDGNNLSDLGQITGNEIPNSFAYKIPLIIGDDVTFDSDIESFLEDLESAYASSSKALEGKDGSYSYVYDLNLQKISGEEDSSQDSGVQASVAGSAQFALTFSEEGFLSAGLAFDYKMVSNYVQEGAVDGVSVSYTAETSYHLSLKAEFTYGDSVEVKEVENPDSYTLLQDEAD